MESKSTIILCIIFTIFVCCSYSKPMPKANNPFGNLFAKFKKDITAPVKNLFNHKWGCGEECKLQRKMRNIIAESRRIKLNNGGKKSKKGTPKLHRYERDVKNTAHLFDSLFYSKKN